MSYPSPRKKIKILQILKGWSHAPHQKIKILQILKGKGHAPHQKKGQKTEGRGA